MHTGETLPPHQERFPFIVCRKNMRPYFSSTGYGSIQRRNRFPRVNKVLPPPMHSRHLHSYLTSIRDYLGGDHPYTSPYPLDMLLSVRLRQYQIPYPVRYVVGQLRAQQICQFAKTPPIGRCLRNSFVNWQILFSHVPRFA